MNRLLTLPLLLVSLATASCADDAAVSVKYAQGYTPGPAAVSVLGVYRDGRMSIDTWNALATPVSTALGALVDRCEPAFGERLQHENEDLFAALDSDTRNDGITEELLAKIAPRAQGDLVLTIIVHGQIGDTARDKRSPTPTAGRTPGAAAPMRGGRGGRGGQTRDVAPYAPGPKPLELSASLYSIRRKQPVARLTVAYTGSSADDAIRRFSTEIGAMIPGSSCKGWSFPPATPPASVAPLLDGP
jgi:hypothetical protein